MRVYLKEGIKGDKENFKVVHHLETKSLTEYDDRFFKGMRVRCDSLEEGGLYIEIDDVLGAVPSSIADFVEFFSIQTTIYYVKEETLRDSGIYKLGAATGTVEKHGRPNEISLEIKIRGDNLEDVRNLYLKIRDGKIMPFDSWETKQAVSNLATNFIRKLTNRIFKKH